jgi:UDP-N-acetylglucosamine/UDP-N-acetylgalactosamine 4-epimerase
MDNKLTGKKILVTGGAGFIGSNLIESFLAAGNEVTCLDNFSTGRKENISDFSGNSNFRLIEGDIRDFNSCTESVRDIDIVFHQAALGSVPRSIADPVSTTDVNIGGFVKMLFASKEAGVKRFIYAASSSTYGDSTELPKIEERIGKPLSPYAVTKLTDELFAENFAQVYNMDIIGLRYFNVFGRKQDPDGPYAAVIPRFLRMLRSHQRPVINGNGLNSRDFTYIDNVVTANRLAAEVTGKESLNQVYNVACGERTTLNRMFELLRLFAGRFDDGVLKIEPVYGPERAGDIPHSHASIDKAKRLLGYTPVYNVEKGLSEAVEWYWHNLK